MKLEGTVALVTGASRRVGRAIAVRLARARVTVAVHYRGSEASAREVVEACRAAGGHATAFRADFNDPTAAGWLVGEVVKQFGRLDILVNNASEFGPMSVDGFDLWEWERTMRVNLTTPMALAHAAREELRRNGGRIINLTDAAVAQPWATHLSYIVSKGGLETLTRALARALAPEVNVVAIAPGVAEWTDEYSRETRERLTERIPLKRAGTVDDIAGAVEYVLRDGDYVTGTTIRVDGGRRLI